MRSCSIVVSPVAMRWRFSAKRASTDVDFCFDGRWLAISKFETDCCSAASAAAVSAAMPARKFGGFGFDGGKFFAECAPIGQADLGAQLLQPIGVVPCSGGLWRPAARTLFRRFSTSSTMSCRRSRF